MTLWLTVPIVIVALVALAGAVMLIVREEHPPPDRYFVVLAVLLVLLTIQALGGCIAAARTGGELESITFIAYLFTAVLVVPVGAAMALIERSRWGSGVLVVLAVTVLACELRLHDLWAVTGA